MRRTAAHTQRHRRRVRSWQRSALAVLHRHDADPPLSGSSAAAARPPDQIGEWSAPVCRGRSSPSTCRSSRRARSSCSTASTPALNSERLWNPTTGTFRPVPYGRNLFCSGHIQLADGRTLIVGGHISAYEGLADTTLYNATTDTYFRGADMAEPRWYPTATQLPDGRVLAFAGDRIVQNRPGQPPPFSDASVNSLPEVYNPNTNTWTSLTSAQLTSPLYPHHVRPLGRPHHRRRPGHDDADPDTGDVDLVDAWVRARSTATARSCTGPTRS